MKSGGLLRSDWLHLWDREVQGGPSVSCPRGQGSTQNLMWLWRKDSGASLKGIPQADFERSGQQKNHACTWLQHAQWMKTAASIVMLTKK